ncbi:hypothetical protein ID866_11058 [Astraeus odoratus]|nr:hypothetical protein ID866_11058 [Astraeus odoratus]
MVGNGSKKRRSSFAHATEGDGSGPAAQVVGTEGSDQENPGGRRSKRGLLSTIGEFITCSRSSSRDCRMEEGAQRIQVMQGLQGSGAETEGSAMAEYQTAPENTEMHVGPASPLATVPHVVISTPDVPNDAFQEVNITELAPTERLVDHGSNEYNSHAPQSTASDVLVAGSSGDGEGAKNLQAKIDSARADVSQMRNISGADNVASGVTVANSALNDIDTVIPCLQPLKVFDSTINKISDIHPYAKLALSVLSSAAQAILDQTNRDQSVIDLLQKISHVYTFLLEDNTLAKINLIQQPLGKLAKLVQGCVEFIQTYAKTKNFWGRLGKNVFSDSSNTMATYNKALDVLTQQCRDLILGTIHHTVETVHHTVRQALGDVDRVQHQMRKMENDVAYTSCTKWQEDCIRFKGQHHMFVGC